MPDTLPIDLGRYSMFVPPDPFEDHVGPFYFRISGDARQAGSVHCVLPTHERRVEPPEDAVGARANFVESPGGHILAFPLEREHSKRAGADPVRDEAIRLLAE